MPAETMPGAGRERGIVMSGASVRGILAGRKVQHRIVLKPQPERFAVDHEGTLCDVGLVHVGGDPWPRITTGRVITRQEIRFAVGQRLWVREGWASMPRSAYALPKTVDPTDPDMAAYYRADFDRSGRPPWSSPTQMPRWASRLTLVVTDVRVQRLQEISCADAIAEGITVSANSATIDCDTPDPRDHYHALWNSIHGADAWDLNPWVVAISFTATPPQRAAETGGRS